MKGFRRFSAVTDPDMVTTGTDHDLGLRMAIKGEVMPNCVHIPMDTAAGIW